MILILFRKTTESFSNSQLILYNFILFCKIIVGNAHKNAIFLHNCTLFVQMKASFS